MPLRSPGKTTVLLLAALALSAGGCATVYNPATGRHELILIDTQSEVSLGRKMDEKVSREMQVVDDPAMTRRLEAIGRRLAQNSDRQELEYRFKVVKNEELNAFAVPGGYIYVHSGLMKKANDDELAGVVAHEIGHVAARHSVKQLQATMGYQALAAVAAGLTGQSYLNRATDVVFDLAHLGYSRGDEYQADKLAVRYVRRAGYNPYGIVTFFQKLQKEAESNERAKPVPFLSSHPPTPERIQKVLDEIKVNPY